MPRQKAISLIDPGGTILVANEALAGRMQKPVAEIVGRNVHELFPPDVALKE